MLAPTRLLPLLLILLAPVCLAQSPQTQPAPDARIAQAISQLSDPSIEVREKAMQDLWSAGRAAEPALNLATQSDDPEIATRARGVLGDFKWGIYPDTPANIIELIRRYRRGTAQEKQTVVRLLSSRGAAGYPILARLSMAEPDNAIRTQIFREIARRGLEALPTLLQSGDLAIVEQVLEMAIADGSDRGCRSYATFFVLQNKLDDKITQLNQQLDIVATSAGTAKTLAYLYRAKGDLASARRMAERSGDAVLTNQLLFEQCDFKELARRHADDLRSDDPESLGFLAAYQRLAGDQAAFAKTIEQLPKLAANRENAWTVAKCLLLNDRPDEGIAILLAAQRFGDAADLFATRHQFRQAIDAAEKGIAAQGADQLKLRAFLARQLQITGQTERSTALLDQIAASVRDSADPLAWATLIDAEYHCQLPDRAFDHLAIALANIKVGDGMRTVLAAVFDERAPEARGWFAFFQRQFPDERPRQTLARIQDVLSKATPLRQVEDWANQVLAADPWDNPKRGPQLRAAIDTLLAYGSNDLALALLTKLIKLAPADQNLQDALTLAVKKHRWDLVIELSSHANLKETPAALYLHGYALTQTNQEQPGRELMQRAMLLPLAEDARRYQFAETLRAAGLADAARHQFQILTRTAEPDSWELGAALRRDSLDASNRADHLRAADDWQRYALDCLRSNTTFLDNSAYLSIPALIHRTRAMGLLKAGKAKEALAEIDIACRIFPANIDLAIDLAPALKAAGLQKEADALVQRFLDQDEKTLVEYPRSALIHNSIAWLLARCQTRLDVAIDHARKGVELEPGNCAILDTLAEVHFQRNEKDQAVQAIDKCIALEPHNPRHPQARTRFQSSTPNTPPPP